MLNMALFSVVLTEFHQMTRGGVYWELLVVCLLTFALCFTNSLQQNANSL